MKRLVSALIACGPMLAVAQAQDIQVATRAMGNFPETVDDIRHVTGATWASVGYLAEAQSQARGDAWDPPSTESTVHASFEQALADAAVLRADGVARLPYRGRYNNWVEARAEFHLQYALEIQNLANVPLNIALTNDLHGQFATSDGGRLHVVEEVEITDRNVSSVHILHNRDLDLSNSGGLSAGLWAPSIAPAVVNDVVYGAVPGYEMNAFEYFGTLGFDANATRVLDCDLRFQFVAFLTESDFGGLATYDFGHTAHLNVRAFDPLTGDDRSSDIRVSLVLVPAPSGAVVLGAGCALGRRRRR